MVVTGEGKDRYRATTRKLLLMPRQVHTPGWVVSPGWQGPAVERRQAAAADGAWPVSTAVPGVQRAPGPVWVSRVRNVETVPWVRISGAGMRRRCGKPTVRGAEFPGRTGCSKSECRQLKGSRKSGAAGPGTPPGWSLYNWPDTEPVLGSERTLTWAGEPLKVAVQQASEPCCIAGEIAGLSGQLRFGAGRHPGVPLKRLRRASIVGMPHFVAVDR